MTDKKLEWVPKTNGTVPQPAGRLCAAWYQAVVPDAETVLYALAHIKGDADKLRAALELAQIELIILSPRLTEQYRANIEKVLATVATTLKETKGDTP